MTKKTIITIVLVELIVLCFAIGFSLGNKELENNKIEKEPTARELLEKAYQMNID